MPLNGVSPFQSVSPSQSSPSHTQGARVNQREEIALPNTPVELRWLRDVILHRRDDGAQVLCSCYCVAWPARSKPAPPRTGLMNCRAGTGPAIPRNLVGDCACLSLLSNETCLVPVPSAAMN